MPCTSLRRGGTGLYFRRGRRILCATLCASLVLLSYPAWADDTAPSRDADVIRTINEYVAQGWADHDVQPSTAATGGEWCRRVFLDVIGRIPSVSELDRYVEDRDHDKKAKLIETLLQSDDYVEEYARNWTTIWTNLLIGRSGGMNRRSLINREGMQQYLRRSFIRNKPYDEFVRELITATGSNRPGDEDYNGAVNWCLDDLSDKAVQVTAKTARIFLGVQVQCTQCHNHPFNNWKQDQFWTFNAFFRQTRALRNFRGRDVQAVRLVDEDFGGEGRPSHPSEAEIYYELRNMKMAVAYPVFIDGTKINPSGYVNEVVRRKELAKVMLDSPYVARAVVNRTWAHFLGYGFTTPVDDMGPHNRPSHPELLTYLSDKFAAVDYDLKDLIRWITLSRPYGLSGRFRARAKNAADDPSKGEPPLFSRFYLRQMRAEELYESLITATRADESRDMNFDERERVKAGWLRQFVIAFGTDENDETTTFNGTIPQTLMMMNGGLMRQATSGEAGGFLDRLARSKMKTADRINYMYKAALARKATTPEIRWARKFWQVRKGNSLEALQDTWWVLLNSNEFVLNH